MQKYIDTIINLSLEVYYNSPDICTTLKEIISLLTDNENITDEDVENIFILQKIAFCHKSRLKNESERRELITTAINKYFLKDYPHKKIIYNTLYELSFSDIVIEVDNQRYFFLIDLLLSSYQSALLSIQLWEEGYRINDPFEAGVAHSKSTGKKIYDVYINHNKNAIKSMKSQIDYLIPKEKILESAQNDPYEINWMLTILSHINFDIDELSQKEKEAFKDSQIILNSASPLKKNDLYKSANLLSFLFFSPISHIPMIIGIRPKIPKEKLLDINYILFSHIFEDINFKPRNTIPKEIQIKTFFYGIPIYEVVTTKNKKTHPMLNGSDENNQIMNKILEKLQGKIPLNSSGDKS